MTIELITNLISTVGFPIAITLVMCWFIYQLYKSGAAREADLRVEIVENQRVNAESLKTLAIYAQRLDSIQEDIKDIKENINDLIRED